MSDKLAKKVLTNFDKEYFYMLAYSCRGKKDDVDFSKVDTVTIDREHFRECIKRFLEKELRHQRGNK